MEVYSSKYHDMQTVAELSPSCILSLTSELHGKGGKFHAPATLPPEGDPLHVVQEGV